MKRISSGERKVGRFWAARNSEARRSAGEKAVQSGQGTKRKSGNKRIALSKKKGERFV